MSKPKDLIEMLKRWGDHLEEHDRILDEMKGNADKVAQALRSHLGTTYAEICERIGYSPSQLSDVVNDPGKITKPLARALARLVREEEEK